MTKDIYCSNFVSGISQGEKIKEVWHRKEKYNGANKHCYSNDFLKEIGKLKGYFEILHFGAPGKRSDRFIKTEESAKWTPTLPWVVDEKLVLWDASYHVQMSFNGGVYKLLVRGPVGCLKYNFQQIS